MRRGPYAKVARAQRGACRALPELKAEHPLLGYRRISAHLRYVDGLAVDPRRRLRRDESGRLAGAAEPRAPAPRKPDTQKPRPTRPTNGGAST